MDEKITAPFENHPLSEGRSTGIGKSYSRGLEMDDGGVIKERRVGLEGWKKKELS